MQKLVYSVLILISLTLGNSYGQIYLTEVLKEGGGSPQLATDQSGKLYFSSGKYMVRYNRQTGIRDSLFKVRAVITGLALSNQDSVLYFTHADTLWKFPFATNTVSHLYAGFQYPTVLCVRPSTGELYGIETGGDNGRASNIARYDLATGQRTRVAGQPNNPNNQLGYVNAIGDTARFGFPRPNSQNRVGCGLAFSLNSDTLFIGDYANRCVRKLHLASRRVTTHAGPGPDSVRAGAQDGQGEDARFSNIMGLAIDGEGNLYVADGGAFSETPVAGNRIRKISPGGRVKTIIGSGIGQGNGAFNNLDFTTGLHGTSAKTGLLSSLVFSPDNDTLYVCLGQRIIKATKRKSSLRFNNLQDRMVGSGKYGVRRILSNSAAFATLSVLSLPANVTFSNDTVNIPETAETGPVILQATQQEDADSIYTTVAVDTFQVIPFVSNKVQSQTRIWGFPNPASEGEVFRIQGENLPAGTGTLRITDATGKIHLMEEFRIENGKTFREIRIPETRGLYFVQIKVGNETIKSTVVRQ
jgi:hypothetical protein